MRVIVQNEVTPDFALFSSALLSTNTHTITSTTNISSPQTSGTAEDVDLSQNDRVEQESGHVRK